MSCYDALVVAPEKLFVHFFTYSNFFHEDDFYGIFCFRLIVIKSLPKCFRLCDRSVNGTKSLSNADSCDC